MIHIHQLDGCAPTPLAHYLKATGILRLIAEQADPEVRGWWDGDHFRLATTLNRKALEDFFLYRYQPTPFVSPWNKGSGFYGAGDPDLAALENARSVRFSRIHAGIAASREQLTELSIADRTVRKIKGKAKVRGMSLVEKERIKQSHDYKNSLRAADKRFRQLKADLIPNLRLAWRGPHREWMDAAMVLADDGSPKFPSLLGTGGNDGRLDFTKNHMQRLAEVFDLDSADGAPRQAAALWLRGALWGTAIPGNIGGSAVGQFLPGTAGGANNSNGPDADSLLNPLDFIFMLEGTLVFTANVSRRLGSLESSRAASPFAVNPGGVAYASASASDESARGEQWMPLWSNPATFAELRRTIAEGRAQVGASPVREPLDMARAVAGSGTARGIRQFQRYGYIERNGQANLAVPLGRYDVSDEKSGNLNCIDDLDEWLRRLKRQARDRNASSRMVMAEQRLVESLFSATQHPDEPGCWQRVLHRLGEIEGIMAGGSGYGAQPIPRLRPEWVAAANDGSAEFRLALAFALQAGGFRRNDGIPANLIRRHWLPSKRYEWWRFATTGTGAALRLDLRHEVVMQGRCGLDDTIDLELLADTHRLLFKIPLQPVLGQRFQPTGFPSLGAATFKTQEGDSLLVESAQSMANHLEMTIWDTAKQDVNDELQGLSHVRVTRNGEFLTDTILESHRLNSPYLLERKKSDFLIQLKQELGVTETGPINRAKLARVLLNYDINALLHGVFLAKKELAGGRLRVARALTAFIEANNVRVAASGGVKNDHVNPQGDTKSGFGNVPFVRDEYTAGEITLYVNIDLAQIRGYGLGQDAEHLLILLALYKLRALTEQGMRLRTACDLEVENQKIVAETPQQWLLPTLAELKQDLNTAIGVCRDRMQVRDITFPDALKKGKQELRAPFIDEFGDE